MTTTGAEDLHPLTRVLDRLGDDVSEAQQMSRVGLRPDEAGQALLELTRLEALIASLRLDLAADVDRAHESRAGGSPVAAVGATSTLAWWATESRQTRRTAGGALRLATALDTTCPLARQALAAGDVLVEQADVIVRALAALPDDLEAPLRVLAEQVLVTEAAQLDAKALAILGARILEHVAPDIAEEWERKSLEDADRRAWDKTRLTLGHDGQGTSHLRVTLPTLHAAMLEKQLHAIAAGLREDRRADQPVESSEAPGDQPTDTPTGDHSPPPVPRLSPEKLGQSFCDWVERLSPDALPAHGGVNPVVVVTMTMDQLTGTGPDAEAPVALDTGHRMTAAQARRWACGAGIIAAVLGTASVVLDMGRVARYFTAAQRLSLALRDRGCTARGCDIPAARCHARHMHPWHLGGPTDLSNGRLLCPRHHTLIHDSHYDHTVHTDNEISFIRRT